MCTCISYATKHLVATQMVQCNVEWDTLSPSNMLGSGRQERPTETGATVEGGAVHEAKKR